MLTALILLAVMTAAAAADMREMASTAQVTHPLPISFSMHRHKQLRSLCIKINCSSNLKDKFTNNEFALSLLVDINECEQGTDVCVNAECNNTVGSYTCRPCFPGFIPENMTTCSEFSMAYHNKPLHEFFAGCLIVFKKINVSL